MATRYKETLHTPGLTPGKPEIIYNDPQAEESLDILRARRRELDLRLSQARAELSQLVDGRGAAVFHGDDPLELSRKLADLRLEIEGIEAGINFIDRKMNIYFRSNAWLKR